MSSQKLIRLVSVSLIVLGLSASVSWGQLPADARFVYEWANTSGVAYANDATLQVTPGTPFSLQVYLRQTAGTTNVLSTEGGLFGGGVRATYGGAGAGSNTGVIVAAASGTTPNTNGVVYNPLFNDTGTSNASLQATTTYASFAAVTAGTPGLGSGDGVLPGADGRILLGTFTFQVIGNGSLTTRLTAETVPTVSDTVTFRNIFTLDSVITSQNLIIAPVPEPTGLVALGGLSLLGGWGVRRWRRGVAPSAGA